MHSGLKRYGASALLCLGGLLCTIFMADVLLGQPWAQRALYSYTQVRWQAGVHAPSVLPAGRAPMQNLPVWRNKAVAALCLTVPRLVPA